ncbi:uncharacterized protein LOC113864957 [Abrus precatorius]|uniref:Uncharacterized protein LOC113864957 n=1 Tax=Abrus precatorius TaxID=3816 RepID=A0A8B8LI58_ABRPR|nr:uncharacterized protein LOC113864957 [Abrus precatorius]
MDSFSFNNLQAEKANAIIKHRKLRRITSLLRFVEVCAVLLLISRFSLKLPVAVKSSSEYFRDLSLFMNSPRFIFLIGNVIIITLFAQFSAQGSERNVPESDLYQEFIKNTKNQGDPEKQKIKTEDVIDEDKRKYPETEKQRMKTGEANIGLEKRYRRCQTEILSEKRRRVLRRCDTEINKKSVERERDSRKDVARICYPEDKMSNEEFRRTVEAFIAKQQRMQREEDYHLV